MVGTGAVVESGEPAAPDDASSSSTRHLVSHTLPLQPSEGEKAQERDSRGASRPAPDVRLHLDRPGFALARRLYYNPYTQLCMLGFVFFLCQGIFDALKGLGAGKEVTPMTISRANLAATSTASVTAFFAGTVNNVLGSRLTLLLGSTGYALYIISYLVLKIHPGAQALLIAAGGYLGVCAGLLWTAQGSLMLSYPTEAQKGRFIAIFWAIFNLGSVIGSSVAFGKEIKSKTSQASNGTYIAFIIFTCIGMVVPMLMADPRKMRRTDGTRIITIANRTWKAEIHGLVVSLKNDLWIILLFPMFFASFFFYTWQFGAYNGALFNIRTRSLNSGNYYVTQIFTSFLVGFLLDASWLTRRARALAAWAVLAFLVFSSHIWAYHYQKTYTRESIGPTTHWIDFKEGPYVGRGLLFVLFSVLDAGWQTTAFWMIGAMSNDPCKLAFFTGFYKSIQSAGGATAWALDADNQPFMDLFIATWAIFAAGLVFMLPMMHMRVKESTQEITTRVAGIEQVVRDSSTHADSNV